MDAQFCTDMAAAWRQAGSNLPGFDPAAAMLADAYEAFAARLGGLASVPPPVIVPDPPLALPFALDPAQYMSVGAPFGAPVMPAPYKPTGGTVEDTFFDVNSGYGVLPSDVPTTFRRCTFDGVNFARDAIGAYARNATFIECEFRHCDNLLRLEENVTLERCWGHDPASAPGSHVDGIEVYGGRDGHAISNIALIDCRIEIPTNTDTNGATAALNIATDWAPISDVLIRRSVLLGGGYPLLVRSGNGFGIANVRLDDVVIDGGRWGAVNGDSLTSAAITQWDNVRKLDGTPIPRP